MRTVSIKELFPDKDRALFNFGVWLDKDEKSINMIGRESFTNIASEPDISNLVFFRLNDDLTVLEEKTLWKPQFDCFFLEDARVLRLNDNSLVVGLTAVMRNAKIFYPFASLIKQQNINSQTPFPEVILLESLGIGKDVTPVDERILFFREFDPKNLNSEIHKLAVIEYQNQQSTPKRLGYIDFPTDLPWALWRIGTTMPPIWVSENEALFLLHGINVVNNQYIYSLGRAKLIRDGDQFRVVTDPKPLLTPSELKGLLDVPIVERFSYRQVLYSCGGIIKKDNQEVLNLYVNAGDHSTYEIGFSLQDLKDGLF